MLADVTFSVSGTVVGGCSPGREVIRYAATKSMLVSIARDIPPFLLAELVKRDLWTPENAEAYAAVIPDPQSRSDSLRALARLRKKKGEREDQARLVAQARSAAAAVSLRIDSQISKIPLPIPGSPPGLTTETAGRHIAEDLLEVRRCWLDDN